MGKSREINFGTITLTLENLNYSLIKILFSPEFTFWNKLQDFIILIFTDFSYFTFFENSGRVSSTRGAKSTLLKLGGPKQDGSSLYGPFRTMYGPYGMASR